MSSPTSRTLVVHPPTTIARDFIDYPYFSDLGAVQLAAVLREARIDTALVDAFALPSSTLSWRADGRAHLGAPVDAVIEAARAAGSFDSIVVAYTPFHRPPHRCDVLGDVLAGLAKLAPRIVLADCHQSGQHYVETPGQDVLASYPEVAAYVKYEAEVTVPRLLASNASGVHRGESPRLDDLPLPAWDAIDLASYQRFQARVVQNLGRGAWTFPIDGRTIPVVTTRGCPFSCVHCSSNPERLPGEPKKQRRPSPDKLGATLAQLVKVTGASRLFVLDELVNVNERHFDAFLDAMSTLDMRFEVPNGMRADYLSRAHLARMKGRVTTVSVSAESGSPRVVAEVVKKQLDLADIVRVAEDAHAVGVSLLIHFMIGLPGESRAEINETLSFAMDLWDRFHAFPAVQFATPLPGTALAAEVARRGRSLPIVEDWGPAFQHGLAASGSADDVPFEVLQEFEWTLQRRLRASSGPEKVIMNLTYACNNRCTFCAVGTRTQLHGHTESQHEHLREYRARGVTMVDFDGGEPTLHPDLITTVRYARHIGYERINVTTNGRMAFYEDYAKKLVRSGLTTLLFSVHGPDAKSHAQQVGVAEAFEQTTGGIRNCTKHAPAGVELGMNVTLTKSNTEKLEDLAQLAWDLGLRWINVQFLTPFGRATSSIAPDIEHAAAITRDLIDRWKPRGMKVQVINLPFCFMPGYESHLEGDLLKLARHMIFVNNEDVNLAAYLAERRVRKPVCAGCTRAVFCGGFYELDKVPEPPWLVAPEDLVRKRPTATDVAR